MGTRLYSDAAPRCHVGGAWCWYCWFSRVVSRLIGINRHGSTTMFGTALGDPEDENRGTAEACSVDSCEYRTGTAA